MRSLEDEVKAVKVSALGPSRSDAARQPNPVRSPAAVAHPPGRLRRGSHSSDGPRAPAQTGAHPVRDDPVVIDLVTRARSGDGQAWAALVERYITLIWSICRRHRLGDADAADVGQSVWLQLIDHLDEIRDPAALPGWLATVTRRECLRVLGPARGPLAAGYVLDAETIPDERAGTAEQELLEELPVQERNWRWTSSRRRWTRGSSLSR